MKNSIKKVLTTFLLIMLCTTNYAEIISTTSIATKSNISATNLHEWPYFNDDLYAESAYVMDANSSVVLYAHNEKKKMFPASLAKVMTAIIVLDKIGENYDDLVTFSYNSVTKDIDKHSVTIGASAGDQLSVKDCLYSLLLPSANDVANALAEYIAGSTSDFALLMNEKAKNLGLTDTHFVNPSGLHDDNQYTTAEDMAKIMQCAMGHSMFMQISSSVSYKHAPIRKYKNPENSNNQVLNTNSIMVPGSGYYYSLVTAGKTGHTDLAGYNLVASAKKNDTHLICVVMNAKSEKQRFTDAKNLFNFHFDNYESYPIKKFDSRFSEKIDTFAINDVDLVTTLNITCNDKAHITVPKNTNLNDIKSKITYQVKDIYNRYAIGYINYTLYDKLIGTCTLEGRNYTNDNSIYTNHLNLSKYQDEDNVIDNTNTSKKNTESHALIYKNANGNIVISKTLMTMITLIIVFIVLFIIGLFLYSRVLTNANFPINKLLFKIRMYFKNNR